MKRAACFLLSVLCFLYGGCYIKKNGTDELPTKDEFFEYVSEKKDTAAEAYYTIKEWIIVNVIES